LLVAARRARGSRVAAARAPPSPSPAALPAAVGPARGGASPPSADQHRGLQPHTLLPCHHAQLPSPLKAPSDLPPPPSCRAPAAPSAQAATSAATASASARPTSRSARTAPARPAAPTASAPPTCAARMRAACAAQVRASCCRGWQGGLGPTLACNSTAGWPRLDQAGRLADAGSEQLLRYMLCPPGLPAIWLPAACNHPCVHRLTNQRRCLAGTLCAGRGNCVTDNPLVPSTLGCETDIWTFETCGTCGTSCHDNELCHRGTCICQPGGLSKACRGAAGGRWLVSSAHHHFRCTWPAGAQLTALPSTGCAI